MRFFVLAATIAICLGGSRAQAAEKTVTLSVGGYDRTYTYHVSDQAKGKLPVVLVLPEAGVTAVAALPQYRWTDLADQEGFIAVGLDALPVDPSKPEMFQTNPSFWSDGSGRGNARRGHLDDTAFVRAVLDDVAAHFTIDPARVYATGLGNGGAMANELGVTMSDRLAAIAPVAGHLWDIDKPATPLSVLMLYGMQDTVEPLEGGMGLNAWTHGVEKRPQTIFTAHAWAKDLACATDPVVVATDQFTSDTWSGCAGKAVVEYVTIHNQGHHWPGGVNDQLPSLGPYGTFDASPFIWHWFQAHPKG